MARSKADQFDGSFAQFEADIETIKTIINRSGPFAAFSALEDYAIDLNNDEVCDHLFEAACILVTED